METPFEELPGVSKVFSGYTGGGIKDPTYAQVGSGTTGHTESIRVHFDPETISYDTLLQVFWRQIDPTDAGGQFVDRGSQYRPAIFFHNAQQKQAAENSRKALAASKRFSKPIRVEITPASTFFMAEEYHQDFHLTHPYRYKTYRLGSGRDAFLKRAWGKDRIFSFPGKPAAPSFLKPTRAELHKQLTPLQFKVTQEEGTEPAFRNEYWDNKKVGIYLDRVSGEPLFSSLEKYPSGTGWPSFYRPLEPENLVFKKDSRLGTSRVEVRSKLADSHLGHVFNDGPAPTGKRYCMNSAALRFVPKESLQKEGLERYLPLFRQAAPAPKAGSASSLEAGSRSSRRRAAESLLRR
jgi:peptide methionine sulfoxide reductase msrA/msrB